MFGTRFRLEAGCGKEKKEKKKSEEERDLGWPDLVEATTKWSKNFGIHWRVKTGCKETKEGERNLEAKTLTNF